MADKAQRYSANAAGRFYVDQGCIGCMLCCEMAPGHFGWNAEEGYAFVSRQPTATEEEARLREALDLCPVDAIGADGLDPNGHRR